MSAVDSIKESFQGTRGKVLIAVGLGLTGWLWWSRRQSGPSVPSGETVDGTASGTGGSGPAGPGTVPRTDDPADVSDGGRPTTNQEWLSRGVDLLVSIGTPAASAHDALTLALSGLPVTLTQRAMVSTVLAALGTPPEGMPPLTNAPSSGGGGGLPDDTPFPRRDRRVPLPRPGTPTPTLPPPPPRR